MNRMYHCAVVPLALASALAFAQAAIPTVDELGAKALFYNAEGKVSTVVSGGVIDVPAQVSTPVAGTTATAPVAVNTGNRPIVAAKKSAPAVLALRASILMVADGGGTREVKPSYRFKSGDKIKLGFTSNKPGYFYLATVGSSGKVQLLAPRKGDAAVLTAGNRYTFPASPTAYFRLDTNTGKEELWAILSEQPLDAINLGGGQVAYVSQSQQPSNTNNASPAVALSGKGIVDVTDQLASKDLVFEEDGEAAYASMKPAAYITTNGAKRPPIMVKLVLQHQ